MLNGISEGTWSAMDCSSLALTGPREPSDGSFASMISAPPLTAAATSPADRTLTSKRIVESLVRS
jgi:hypothetical protein